MSLPYEFRVTKVYVNPSLNGFQEVIVSTEWTMKFSLDGFFSTHAGDTTLDTTDIQSFVPLAQVSKPIVQAWVLAQSGGNEWLEAISAFHQGRIERAKALASANVVQLPFVDPL
jgi:hypothetical protein